MTRGGRDAHLARRSCARRCWVCAGACESAHVRRPTRRHLRAQTRADESLLTHQLRCERPLRELRHVSSPMSSRICGIRRCIYLCYYRCHGCDHSIGYEYGMVFFMVSRTLHATVIKLNCCLHSNTMVHLDLQCQITTDTCRFNWEEVYILDALLGPAWQPGHVPIM